MKRPAFKLRRLAAITRKESLQIFRDPSTLLVAFVLPIVMLFLFAYAVSLDTRQVRIGVVLESDSEAAQSLAAAFAGAAPAVRLADHAGGLRRQQGGVAEPCWQFGG